MIELGFSVEHRGGSEWTFRTSKPRTGAAKSSDEAVNGRRSIVIHQPHPEPKMSAVMLQRIGRRFSIRFGWEKGNFEFEADTPN